MLPPPPLLLLLLLGVHTAQSSQLDIRAVSVTTGVREVVLDNGAPTPHAGGPPLRPVTKEDERPIVVVPAGRPAIVPAASVTTPLAGGDAQDTDITADEEDEDEEDQPLRLRPLGELPTRVPLGELPIQPAPPPPPVDFPVWVPPQAAAASGPLREFLQPALNVSQDFETAERTGYTIRVSTATDLPAATDAFIADATASGHALFAGARAAILLALQQSAVDVMRSQSQPPLTAAQWVEAVALDPANAPLAAEYAAQARRVAVRIGGWSSQEFDDAARPLYNHARGDEHVATLLGSLARMIRPSVVVERGGGGYVTPFLLQALAENVADFSQEVQQAAGGAPSNYLRPWYFEKHQDEAAESGSTVLVRQERFAPVLHCIHSAGEPSAAATLAQLGLEETLLKVHRVTPGAVASFATELSEMVSPGIDLLWFGSAQPGTEHDTEVLNEFVDAYVPLLNKDQGYFAVQFKNGYFGSEFGEAVPWADGVEELRARVQVAANAHLRGDETDEEEDEESVPFGESPETDQVEVEMINLLEPHKWRAGSLTLFKLSLIAAHPPLGNVLVGQQLRLGYDALAKQEPAQAVAHFDGGVQIAQRYQLRTADAEFGQGLALSLVDKHAPASDDEKKQLNTLAMDAFRRAVESDPLHAAARNNLGMLLAREVPHAAGGDDEGSDGAAAHITEAIEHLQAAVESVPTWPHSYANWGKIYAEQGDRAKELEVYELALENGVAWGSTMQRPERFLRGLPAHEFYEPSAVTLLPSATATVEAEAGSADVDLDLSTDDEHWVAALEREWIPIRDEVLAVLAEHDRHIHDSDQEQQQENTGLFGLSGAALTEVPGALARRVHRGDGVKSTAAQRSEGVQAEEEAGRGLWNELRLLDEGRLANRNAPTNFPHTMRVVTQLLGEDPLVNAAGVVKFSWLAPGARIQAHCGPHNLRLRLHLGLVVPSPPSGAQIRVGNAEPREWEAGKAFVFDESFEHEVYNNGTTPRLVLIVDVWQPALEMEARRELMALRERWKLEDRSFIDGLHQAPPSV